MPPIALTYVAHYSVPNCILVYYRINLVPLYNMII